MKDRVKYILELPVEKAEEGLKKDCDILGLKFTEDIEKGIEAFKKLLPRIHPGAIVLLHSTSSTNAQILDELLNKWEDMGYSFHSLNELIEHS